MLYRIIKIQGTVCNIRQHLYGNYGMQYKVIRKIKQGLILLREHIII